MGAQHSEEIKSFVLDDSLFDDSEKSILGAGSFAIVQKHRYDGKDCVIQRPKHEDVGSIKSFVKEVLFSKQVSCMCRDRQEISPNYRSNYFHKSRTRK